MDQPYQPVHNPGGFTNEFKEPDNRSQPPYDAQRRARAEGVSARALLVGGATVIALFGMMAALLCYVCVANECTVSGTVLTTTAALGKVLTISQLASHVAPVVVPLVMGLCAFQIGARWLQSSQRFDGNRPSPLQLGLLMSICNSANLSALFQAIRYMLGANKDLKKQTLPSPTLMKRSVVLLFTLLTLIYAISGADAWFHASSKATLIQKQTSFVGTPGQVAFGRAINETRCQEASTSTVGGPIYTSSCGLFNGLAAHDNAAFPEGLRAVSNSSNINRVAFTDDQTAILAPSNVPSNTSFSANTIGVKTSCISITKECLKQTTSGGLTSYGPAAYLNINCTGQHVYNLTLPGASIPEGPLDSLGNVVPGYQVPSNPFNVGSYVMSYAYEGTQDAFINNTGWFVHGNAGAYNVIYCSLSALNVDYTYTGSQYILDQASPASVQDTQYIVTVGFGSSPLGTVKSTVEGAGIQTVTTYEEAFSLELSRRILGLGATLYVQNAATEVHSELATVGSELNLIPFTILLACMTLFGFIVIFVSIHVVVSTRGVGYVRLAALHITEPLVLVNALYGPVDWASSWNSEAFGKFIVEGEGDRLFAGAVGVQGGEVFAVGRRDAHAKRSR